MKVATRDFPPVEVQIERPDKLSPSSLTKLDSCPRSFYFYRRYEGGISSEAMAAGAAWHLWAERVLRHMLDEGMTEFPPDVGREWMNLILSEHKELVVPESHHNRLRGMCWNFCEATYLDPRQVISVEDMWEVEVGGWAFRGKIDLATIVGPLGTSTDWKTGFHLPSQADVEGDFKTRAYCLLLAEGHPTPNCPDCNYSGRRECDTCGGEGVIHVERPIPRLGRVYSEQVYPQYTDSETGEMVSRGVEMDANAISDFRKAVELLVERLEYGLETKEWPAQAGSWCSRCPSPKECPIPAHLNTNLPLTTEHEARTAASLVLDHERRKKDLDKALKDYVAESGSVEVGDLEFVFEKQEKRELDQDALAEKSASGEPFDAEEIYKKNNSTRFIHRLNPDAVRQIQTAVENGESKASQAREFGVPVGQINKAIERDVATTGGSNE